MCKQGERLTPVNQRLVINPHTLKKEREKSWHILQRTVLYPSYSEFLVFIEFKFQGRITINKGFARADGSFQLPNIEVLFEICSNHESQRSIRIKGKHFQMPLKCGRAGGFYNLGTSLLSLKP